MYVSNNAVQIVFRCWKCGLVCNVITIEMPQVPIQRVSLATLSGYGLQGGFSGTSGSLEGFVLLSVTEMARVKPMPVVLQLSKQPVIELGTRTSTRLFAQFPSEDTPSP